MYGAVGYQMGLIRARYTGMTILLIITFSFVIALIADLDRQQEGFIKVSQQALMDLKEKYQKDKKNSL